MNIGNYEEFARDLAQARANEDPTALLLADHKWLRTALRQLETLLAESGEAAISALRDDLGEMATLIAVHMRQEEDAYFPAVRPLVSEEARKWIATAYPEHDTIRDCQEDFLNDIDEGTSLSIDFRAYQSALSQHFTNEEEFIFPEVPAILAKDAAKRLLAEMERLAQA